MKANWNGNFDIVFTGATLNCNNERRIKALKNCIMNPEESFMIPINTSLTEEELIDAIWYNSTYYHESRHVHDYLLCPILNYGYRLRLSAVLHASQVLLKWEQCNTLNYNVLPLPIQKWFRLREEDKLDYLENWSNLVFKATASMAFVDESQSYRDAIENSKWMSEQDDITSLLLYASSCYELYDYIQKPRYDVYYREYSVRTLMEASAISVQMASSQILYGEKGASAIWNLLKNAAKTESNWRKYENTNPATRKRVFTNYTVVLSYIVLYLEYNRTIGYENLFIFTSYLINWCLSGNLLSTNAEVSPGTRLNKFVEHDYAKGMTLKDIVNEPLAVFQYWDEKLGGEGLDYHDYFASNRIVYEEIAESFRAIGLDRIAEYVKMISDASQIMTSLFFKAPNLYLNPTEYIYNFHNYVNVPLRFVLSEPIPMIKTEKAQMELEDNLKNKIFNETDNIVNRISTDQPFIYNPTSQSFEPSKYEILSYKKCEEFRTWFLFAESLFKEDSKFNTEKLFKEIVKKCEIRYII